MTTFFVKNYRKKSYSIRIHNRLQLVTFTTVDNILLKSEKYRIKITTWLIFADAKMYYFCNFDIYLKIEKNKINRVVKQLNDFRENLSHDYDYDYFFTDLSLAKDLLKKSF